jgi:membrane-associated phospholipid phosphatase
MRATAPSRLLAVSAAALLGFRYMAGLVARRQTEDADNDARDQLQASRAPVVDAAATASGPLGKEYLHFPAAVVVGLGLRQHGLGLRAAVPVAASVVSEIMNRVVTKTIHIRVVPPKHPEYAERKPSFPSGHALEATAVAFTCAYVLAREDLVPAVPAFAAAALVSAASSGGRLLLDRHWVSDAIGGSLLGVAVWTACGAAYEALPS